ncbi:DUF4419 domain-containing protein [Chloroflexia bacterium SDU3-3]|nr:DUF4419 domain-containing protein [Chloroflexia bacterium SDU3-3]
MTTFPVANVLTNTQPLRVIDSAAAITNLLPYPIEQIGPLPPLAICGEEHPLIAAAVEAFTKRRPLLLSPDIIWFCIAQGFASHMALHAEKLRGRFVDHQGKKRLEVRRDDFAIGRVNPWNEVFDAFSQQIETNMGVGMHRLIVANFTTTDSTKQAASAVAMMDSFQYYFEFQVFLLGYSEPTEDIPIRPREGIPSITLLGTPADWRSVRQRALALGEYGLAWWVNELRPILDGLVASAEGQTDRAFWKSFFHRRSGWEGEEITGWVHTLFPYLKEGDAKPYANPRLPQWRERLRAAQAAAIIQQSPLDKPPSDMPDDVFKRRIAFTKRNYGLSARAFPVGFCSAPITLITPFATDELRFIGGLFGVAPDAASGALTPAFGWAVAYDNLKPERQGY